MKTFSAFQNLLHSAANIVDRLCQPNPKYTPGVAQREVALKRNKAVFLGHFTTFAIFTCNMFFVEGDNTYNIVSYLYLVVILASLLLPCKYHPQIFKVAYNLCCGSWGLFMVHLDKQTTLMALIAGQIFPLCVQMLTGSYWHCFFQALWQVIFMNTILQNPMESMLSYSSPESVVGGLTHASNFSYALQMGLVAFIGSYIDQTFQEAQRLETKKNEAESQKVFLLGFSHELRNLINSLTGNVKLASFEKLGDRAQDLLRNAEVCGELLMHMINNILDTGKTQIGELEVDMSPTRTYDAFERIWGICSELIRRKDLKGHMKIPKNMPKTLVMDHHRLTQIFLNLVGNAIKFTHKGSVNIKIEWLPDRSAVDEDCFKPYPFNNTDDQDEGLFEKQQTFLTLNEEYAILTPEKPAVNKVQLKEPDGKDRGILKMIVSDTGCGVTPQQKARMFRKFSQVCIDESKRKLGTGLGLYITKQLCEKMGGEIRVYSQQNLGSSFIFCLPILPVEEKTHFIEDIESARVILAKRKLQAMIVDDAMSNHNILKSFFEKLHINVKEIALNGLEAVNKYSGYTTKGDILQIVTMDLDMPIMNGKEAAQKIREIEKEKRITPCFMIIISGNCVESEINECIDRNGKIRANAFMRKPIKMDDLTRLVISRFASNQMCFEDNK